MHYCSLYLPMYGFASVVVDVSLFSNMTFILPGSSQQGGDHKTQ
jgi:hypothetical protein